MIRDLRYAAKSTTDPKGSTDRQHARIVDAIQAEGSEPYGRPYTDQAATAYHGNRGQDLTAVMAEAERLAADGQQVRLWFDHSDRSSRGDGVEARHTVEVMLWALKAGVELRSVRDPETFRTLSTAASGGDRNHGDSKVKAERVAEGHADRRAAGGYHGGPEPYALAYPVDPDQPTRTMPDGTTRPNTRPWLPLMVRPEQAAVVARMAQMILEGASLKAVARTLNAEGVPTGQPQRRPSHGKPKRPSQWHGETIHRIITNPVYAALTKDGHELAHAPVIDRETYAKVLALLGERRRNGAAKGGRPTSAPALFLNGHLRCGSCDAAMGYRSKRNRGGSLWERYVCTEHERMPEACPQMPLPVAAVEGTVLEAFRQRALGREGSLSAFQASYQSDLAHVQALLTSAERELAKAEAATARVKADYKAGDISAAEWRELRAELEDEQTAAGAQVELLTEREHLTRLRASDQVHDAFTDALIILGQAADRALRGELPLAGVRDSLRALFPVCTWRQDAPGPRVELGEPAPQAVALHLSDELPAREGEAILDRASTSATVGLTSVAVIAPIPVELP